LSTLLADEDAVSLEAAGSEDVPSGSSFWRYLIQKVAGSIASLLMVVLLGFFAFRILPGDPVLAMTRGRRVDAAQLAQLTHQFGLDRPWWEQFFVYLRGLVEGQLGTSFTYGVPVSKLIGEFVGPTLLLTGISAVLAIVLGLWIGQKAAWVRNTSFDRLHTGAALLLWSVPTFWLGLILLLIFGGGLQILPTGGMESVPNLTGIGQVLDIGYHLILPVLTMVAVTYAQYLLVMRASLIEEMSAPYLVTARAKGSREDQVRRHHAVPNALLPTVTLVFLQLGGLIAGAVTVEVVFSWPGLGYLTYQALSGPDLPLLQGTFVVFSSIIIVTNLLADLVYRFLDPRVRAA
jgi:peptide/nickel transport system permease protein